MLNQILVCRSPFAKPNCCGSLGSTQLGDIDMKLKELNRRHLVASTALCLFASQVPATGSAQTGPITLVVPFAAGGATDVVSRLVAQKLTGKLGRTVIVENVAGGGGMIGASKVARAAPNGDTLLMGTVSTHAINPLATTPSPYDPIKNFSHISLLATVPNVLLVHSSVKAQNVQELVAYLKSQPVPLSYGSSGVGTPPHLSGELFKAMAKVDMVHIPYKGGAPAMNDLLGGQIPILFDVLTGAAGHIKSGSVRALAISTATRSPTFPNIPTISESGLPGYETYTWNAVFGPAGMSRDLIESYSKALQAVVADPEVQTKLKELSANPVGSTPEGLQAQVKAELDKWGPVIKAIGGLKKD
jgi:tripartite-type tricarboxylate transporter receptor subunit TctC